VVVAIGAARDPARCDRPAVLDRPGAESPHVGHGIHYCLGAVRARMEVATALGTLFHRFSDVALAAPADELPRRPGAPARPRLAPVSFTSSTR
jgi:cytochrome P450